MFQSGTEQDSVMPIHIFLIHLKHNWKTVNAGPLDAQSQGVTKREEQDWHLRSNFLARAIDGTMSSECAPDNACVQSVTSASLLYRGGLTPYVVTVLLHAIRTTLVPHHNAFAQIRALPADERGNTIQGLVCDMVQLAVTAKHVTASSSDQTHLWRIRITSFCVAIP